MACHSISRRLHVVALFAFGLRIVVAQQMQPEPNGCLGTQQAKLVCSILQLSAQQQLLTPGRILYPDPNGTKVLEGQLLSTVPAPSPASGAVYSLDVSTGLVQPTRRSSGPILTERGETIGKHNLAFGFAYQHFNFDKVDGFDTSNLYFDEGLGLTRYNLRVALSQYTAFATYGLTNSTDLSVAVPSSAVQFDAALTFPVGGMPRTISRSQHAAGLGDVTLQLKQNVYKSEGIAVAIGLNTILPTGDPYNGLGIGATAIRPFVAASKTFILGTPHLNLGFESTGQSVLAGDVIAHTEGNVPKQVVYAAGFDAPVGSFTVTFDVIGREIINGERVGLGVESGSQSLANTFYQDTFGIVNGSAGLKYKTRRNILLTGNLLFRMDDGGIRSRVVPLLGLSYTWR